MSKPTRLFLPHTKFNTIKSKNDKIKITSQSSPKDTLVAIYKGYIVHALRVTVGTYANSKYRVLPPSQKACPVYKTRTSKKYNFVKKKKLNL